jgi:hypothetical protein
MNTNPYRGLPSTNFWSTGVAQASPGSIDPMISAKFTIGPDDLVSTMGSCFAQHISRYLTRIGLQYFVTETDDGISAAEALRRNFGVFSARYGNVYTVRQARQLFERAFGIVEETSDSWSKDGRVLDPMRPQIEPDGFVSTVEMETSREIHLAAVRRVFLESDVLVFTLGLTEAFMSNRDGLVYPVAPGVSGGTFSPSEHRFVNFSVTEVVEDLSTFVSLVQNKNPNIRILITVSPVPLIATFEPRHVLVSNAISKATLRVAAAQVADENFYVEYFPSYEIVVGSADGYAYFAPDLRQVEQRGVDHVMRIFQKHLVSSESRPELVSSPRGPIEIPPAYLSSTRGIVCDEEVIEESLRSAGL